MPGWQHPSRRLLLSTDLLWQGHRERAWSLLWVTLDGGDSSFNTFVLLGTDFRKKQVLSHSRLEGSSGAHLVHPSSQRRANFEVRAGFSGFLSVEL